MINKVSKKWNDSVKTLINDSKLNLLRVYDNTFVDQDTVNLLSNDNLHKTEHCDFCGQRIKYVSILEFDKNSNISHFQIGKECMSYLYEYGMKIEGLEHAKFQIENAVKKLIKASSQRSRKEKYSKEFKSEIEWFDSLDENFKKKNHFLTFLGNRLKTGDGVITEKMLECLKRAMSRYTAESTKNIESTQKQLIKKIDILLEQINIEYNGIKNGTYEFVNSIKSYVMKKGNATRKQLDALNDVHERIKKMNKNRVQNLINSKLNIKTDNSKSVYIPW